jgi:hypothetical protein
VGPASQGGLQVSTELARRGWLAFEGLQGWRVGWLKVGWGLGGAQYSLACKPA